MHKNKIQSEIAVLGGGPAGYVAAIRASQLGAKVVLIEEKELGGVCMNIGCIPTKSLLKTSEILTTIKKSKEFGVQSKTEKLSWSTAVVRKDRIVKNLGIGIEQLMVANNVSIIKGRGIVVNPNKLLVNKENEEIEINCNKLIIATGSEPLIPSFIKGIKNDGVITSTDALSLQEPPESIVIIGGGVIGVEFATMFSSLGTNVTVIEAQDRIISHEDEEISTELLKILKRKGIKFKLSSKLTEIIEKDEGLIVSYELNGKSCSTTCEKVLLAVGRQLNSDIASSISSKTENGRIVVDEYMQTSVPNVYAAGDVIGGKLLAHLAFMEGRVAAENAVGMQSKVNYNAVPSCIYTSPESASVGLTEREAIEKGIKPKIGSFAMRHNGRSLTLGEREGFVKIIADENGVIIGGQILGANASEMISQVTLAITVGATAEIISDMIHPHPSISEAIWEACGEIAKKSIHKV